MGQFLGLFQPAFRLKKGTALILEFFHGFGQLTGHAVLIHLDQAFLILQRPFRDRQDSLLIFLQHIIEYL
jgi:hypothetical protein